MAIPTDDIWLKALLGTAEKKPQTISTILNALEQPATKKQFITKALQGNYPKTVLQLILTKRIDENNVLSIIEKYQKEDKLELYPLCQNLVAHKTIMSKKLIDAILDVKFKANISPLDRLNIFDDLCRTNPKALTCDHLQIIYNYAHSLNHPKDSYPRIWAPLLSNAQLPQSIINNLLNTELQEFLITSTRKFTPSQLDIIIKSKDLYKHEKNIQDLLRINTFSPQQLQTLINKQYKLEELEQPGRALATDKIMAYTPDLGVPYLLQKYQKSQNFPQDAAIIFDHHPNLTTSVLTRDALQDWLTVDKDITFFNTSMRRRARYVIKASDRRIEQSPQFKKFITKNNAHFTLLVDNSAINNKLLDAFTKQLRNKTKAQIQKIKPTSSPPLVN